MNVLTIEFIILTILQFSMLLFFSTYVLDLYWSRKQLLTIVLIIFLPTFILFNFIGALSILYYSIILSIMVYRETKTIISILHVFMGLILSVISDNLSYIIAFHFISEIGNEKVTIVINYSFYIVLALVLAFCYKRIAKYMNNRWGFHRLVSYILVFLGVATVIFIYMNIMSIDYDNFYESVQNNLVLFLIYFILLAISMFVLLYSAFKQYQIKQREQEMRNFESYVTSLEQINQDMRKFKHDYVNILSSLRTFIDDKNYEGLHTYFYDHILEANHHEQLNEQAMLMLNNLKINSLKGLLTTKILQAQSYQVPLYIEIVEEISEIPVDPIALNRMVGIVLDNAIEAARDIENGEVRVAIINMNEVVLLVVSNTFDEKLNLKVHEIYKEGFSTKGENRGLGLANLRQIKNDLHNVSLNTKISPPYFIQEIEFQKE